MIKVFWKFCIIVLVYAALICDGSKLNDYYKQRNFQCSPIKEKLCLGIGYNFTTMPNIMGNENQKEASRRFREFHTLMTYQYSEKFHFFLCTLFFPMCTNEVNIGIPACRPLCEDMRRERAPIMRAFDFKWSDSINCSKLPWKSVKNHLCIPHPSYMGEAESGNGNAAVDDDDKRDDSDDGDDNESVAGHHLQKESEDEWNIVNKSHGSVHELDSENEQRKKHRNDGFKIMKDASSFSSNNEQLENVFNDQKIEKRKHKSHEKKLPTDAAETVTKHFLQKEKSPTSVEEIKCVNPRKFVHSKRSGTCIPRCGPGVDVFFSWRDKNIVFLVSSTVSSLCFVAAVFTVATFLVDSLRFRYPERPVVFIAMSYCLYSLGYLMRSVRGISSPFSCVHNETWNVDHVVTSGLKDTSCYASFFILYFFQMAGSAWWVILNITWLLSAAFKWGHEAIEAVGYYFHVVAWSVPALQTISVLLRGKVDGDELTGLCNVGNLDPDSLMYHVIIPLALYLLVGTVTLLFGFSYLFKIRRVIKRDHRMAAVKLEKLMLKIGIFSVLYAVPMTCVIAVNFWQFRSFSRWMNEAERSPCTVHDLNDKAFKEMYPLNAGTKNNFKASWNLRHRDDDYDLKQSDNIYFFDVDATSEIHTLSSRNRNSYYVQKDFTHSLNSNVKSFSDCHLPRSVPYVSILICKIIMSLIPGILTGIWIGSTKTVYSWMKFYNSCRCRKTQSSTTDRNVRSKTEIGNKESDVTDEMLRERKLNCFHCRNEQTSIYTATSAPIELVPSLRAAPRSHASEALSYNSSNAHEFRTESEVLFMVKSKQNSFLNAPRRHNDTHGTSQPFNGDKISPSNRQDEHLIF